MKKSSHVEKVSVAKESAGLPSSELSKLDFLYSATVHGKSIAAVSSFTVDLGCTSHTLPVGKGMRSVSPALTPIFLADRSCIVATSNLSFDLGSDDGSIHKALFIPKLMSLLLSVSRLADSGIATLFTYCQRMFLHACAFGIWRCHWPG